MDTEIRGEQTKRLLPTSISSTPLYINIVYVISASSHDFVYLKYYISIVVLARACSAGERGGCAYRDRDGW